MHQISLLLNLCFLICTILYFNISTLFNIFLLTHIYFVTPNYIQIYKYFIFIRGLSWYYCI